MEKHLVRAWLLQHPRVECDGKPLNIRLKKAQALLFYLLVQKKATREEAAGLLWGGEEDSLAHRHLRDNLYLLKKAALVELLDLAHEQMTFYGIQTYQTQVMREHIQIALALTQGRDPTRYAVNRRYQGYLLVMENRYEEGREELLRSLMLLRDGVTDDVELRLQSAYAHDYIGEAYRKQGSYEKAIGEYQMAIQTIGTFPTSTSKPMFYVNWAQAALAQADYTAARQLYQAVQKLRSLVSMTMLTALQAIDLSDHKAMSPVTQKIHDHARQTVTFMENDDLMYQRTEAMEHLVESNQLLADCPVPFTI